MSVSLHSMLGFQAHQVAAAAGGAPINGDGLTALMNSFLQLERQCKRSAMARRESRQAVKRKLTLLPGGSDAIVGMSMASLIFSDAP